MIEIQCMQQAGNDDNPYEIQKILLLRTDDNFQAMFMCETQEIADTLWSSIDRMRVMMKEHAVNRKLSFSFLKIIPAEGSGNCVVLTGNILDAVNALIRQGILRGRNQTVFEDPEEEEIQIFLQDSAKKNAAFVAAKHEEETTDEQEEGNRSQSALSSKCCTLF